MRYEEYSNIQDNYTGNTGGLGGWVILLALLAVGVLLFTLGRELLESTFEEEDASSGEGFKDTGAVAQYWYSDAPAQAGSTQSSNVRPMVRQTAVTEGMEPLQRKSGGNEGKSAFSATFIWL
jgi:hypothetical protein